MLSDSLLDHFIVLFYFYVIIRVKIKPKIYKNTQKNGVFLLAHSRLHTFTFLSFSLLEYFSTFRMIQAKSNKTTRL